MLFTQVLSVVLSLGVAHVAAATPETEQAIEKVYLKYVNSDDPASIEVPVGEDCVNVNLPEKVEAYQLETPEVTCYTWPILDCVDDPNAQAWDRGGNFLDPSQDVLSIRCLA